MNVILPLQLLQGFTYFQLFPAGLTDGFAEKNFKEKFNVYSNIIITPW